MRYTGRIAFLLVFTILFSALGSTVACADVQNAERIVAAGGRHTVFLNGDGTVSAIGENKEQQLDTQSWTDVVSVAAGIYTTFGIRADGTVYATGWNKHGQCDTGGWTDIRTVSASDYHTVGLKNDGTAVATGFNSHGECRVEAWKDITQVATGEYFSVGLQADGTVVTTGDNRWGQCDVNDWRVVAVDAGYWHTVGLLGNGKVIAAGRNNKKQCNVSGWADVVQISAGLAHTVALLADGTVVATGDNTYGQCDVSQWHDISYVSAGMFHTIGVMRDGTVVSAGSDEWGQSDVAGMNIGQVQAAVDSARRLKNRELLNGFLKEHPEYRYGEFLPTRDGGEMLLLRQFQGGPDDNLDVVMCVPSPDGTGVDTYYFYSKYHDICYDPQSCMLAGVTGGTDARAVLLLSYVNGRAYYWTIGYELAWDQDDNEYYEYTRQRMLAVPNTKYMEHDESTREIEYITEEESVLYDDYLETLQVLVLQPIP